MSVPAAFITQGLPGGSNAVLNILNAQTVKASPGILVRVLVVTPGSSGNLTLNDCAAVGDATSVNEINTVAASSLTPGQTIYMNWPCSTGICISAVPSGSQFSATFS